MRPSTGSKMSLGEFSELQKCTTTNRARSLVNLPAALSVVSAAVQCKQLIATHEIFIKSYHDVLGVKEAWKELILYAVGNVALAPLKSNTSASETCQPSL
jgi:hypothetical protein